MNDLPPSFSSAIFNTNAFGSNIYLTRQAGDLLYLPISAGSNLSYITGITAGVGQASKALTLNASGNITAFPGNFTFTGGSSTLSGLTALTSTSIIGTTITLGGTSIGSTQAGYLTSITAGTASASKALVVDSNKDIVSIRNMGATALTLASTGTIGNCLNMQSSGQAMAIFNNGTNNQYTSFNNDASGNTTITSFSNPSFNTYFLTTDGRFGMAGVSPRSAYQIDCGQTSRDYHLVLYQHSTPIGTAGFGYNSSTNILNIATASGTINFYNSTANNNLGTNTVSINSSGDLTSLRNVISNSGGLHAFGFNSTGLSAYGGGCHMHYGAGIASVIGYDYNAGVYKDLSFGNSALYIRSGGNIGIGVTTTAAFPLDIAASVNGSFAGTYGFLNSTGAAVGVAGTGTVAVSLRCTNRIFCTEIDCQSDLRLKTDIRDITDEEALAFLSVNPINYKMIESKEKSYGYLAQDVLKASGETHLLEDTVELHPKEGVTEMVDEDGFVSPADHIFTINYQKTIPLLHKVIQIQQKQIEENRQIINTLVHSIEGSSSESALSEREVEDPRRGFAPQLPHKQLIIKSSRKKIIKL